jgi:hypothetical protein
VAEQQRQGEPRHSQQDEGLRQQQVLESTAAPEPAVQQVRQQQRDAAVDGVEHEVEGGAVVPEDQVRRAEDPAGDEQPDRPRQRGQRSGRLRAVPPTRTTHDTPRVLHI